MTTVTQSRLRSALVEFQERYRLPAIGGGVLTSDGGFDMDVVGVRVRGGTDPVRPDDPWHLGSCGKAITAVLYARLVEAGAAEWGARLPELFSDLGAAMDRGWRDISIDEVFVHRAGLPANLGRKEMIAAWRDARPLPEQRTEVAATALATPPRQRGHFGYSNLGYVLIGAAIERLTGLPYETALARHVLDPLGITTAGFGPPERIWGHGGTMLMLGPLGAFDLGRTRPADPSHPESDNPAVMSPAGRLHLSLADWARFQRVFITDGGDLLRPETIERLLTPATGPGPWQAMGWAAVGSEFTEGSFAQQGSNTYWVATAVIDRIRERTALVVFNEGRAKLIGPRPAHLAVRLLTDS
jgi:CubicO group peptidase (beta-lactamase class C family)